MNKLLVAFMMVAFVTPVFAAKKDCTGGKTDPWMAEDAFKKKVTEMGYTIKKFKKPGKCYEIYGTDKDGKKVEIYFNPIDGSIFQAK
jgi:hypothetical protein